MINHKRQEMAEKLKEITGMLVFYVQQPCRGDYRGSYDCGFSFYPTDKVTECVTVFIAISYDKQINKKYNDLDYIKNTIIEDLTRDIDHAKRCIDSSAHVDYHKQKIALSEKVLAKFAA
jgi:hypothetical protein